VDNYPKQYFKCLFAAILLFVLNALPFSLYAEEAGTNENETIYLMPQVTVIGKPIDTLSATEIIDQELIEKLPGGDGFITDLLTTVPGVLFSEGENDSKTGGEITPAEISISGGRAHENNIMLDGLSINNFISPDSTTDNVSDIPSHSQEYFIPEHLIKDFTVYRSNIPARYGGFTGGVIIANTKDPEPELTGEIGYATTHSDWGNFFIDSSNQEEFSNSTSS